MTQHVLVIGGGQNVEHEISLETAAAITGALHSRGFEVSSISIGRDGLWRHGKKTLGTSAAASLAAALPLLEQADVVFPAVHGPVGEDGTLAALCALTQKPMVGSGLRAGAVGMDKWVTKLVAEAIGIPVAPGRLVRATDMGNIEFESEVVVKPVSAGSSYGVTFVRDACQLDEALRIASRYDDHILIEHVVHGREIDVAVLREADGSRWAHPRWRSTPAACSTRPPSTTEPPSSRCPPASEAQTVPQSRGRHWQCSTRSAASESHASTSSSPMTVSSSTKSTRCPG
jgi:D-alanine-D-alanine ligase